MSRQFCLSIVIAAVAGLFLSDRVQSQDAKRELTVEVTVPVHPILVRNDNGSLLKIVVNVVTENKVTLESMTFGLKGTDDLSDIASLRLLATGNSDDFKTQDVVGDLQQPGESIVIPCRRPLQQGKNVFWLSCRLNDAANLMHKIVARCARIETSMGPLIPAVSPSPVRHAIGIALRKHLDDGVHTYRIPAMTTSAKGSLLVVYDMRRRMGRDLQEDIDIGLSRSTDGGRTWEPVKVIMDMGEFGGLPQEQNGCSDPGIIVDHQTGEIFCFAVWMNGKPGKHQWTADGSEPGFEIGKSAQMLVVRSTDDGVTWSQPENLTRQLKREAWWLFAPSPQQGIQLRDGTLVMPSQGRDELGKEFSTIMSSRDHGRTWTVGTPAFIGGSENQAVSLVDGSVMLNMRNELERFRAVMTTADLGKTWKPHPTNRNTLIEPNCNGSLLAVDVETPVGTKKILFFANPHTQKFRTHQTIQVSFDEGMTWPDSHHRLLDEGKGAGYPSLTRIDDKQIGIVYEGSQSQLAFQRFTIDELLNPIK